MVSQISRPMQIALAVTLVLAVAWLTVLRPHGETSSSSAATSPAPPAATASQKPPRAKHARSAPARRARAAARAHRRRATAARHRAADPGTRVLAALDARRVAVVLFWDGRTAEDRAVRSAVAHVDRHHGRARVFVARLSAIADYAAIVSSAGVTASPTVLVIDAKRQVRKISGFTVTSEIDQAVQDALHVPPAAP